MKRPLAAMSSAATSFAAVSLVAVSLAAALPAQAEIYRCRDGGGIVFSDRPCDADAAPLDVKPAAGEYDALDGERAQQRALAERVELSTIEREREEDRRAARLEHERRKKEESERCERIRREKAEAEERSRGMRRADRAGREQERAKHWAEREFFECR